MVDMGAAEMQVDVRDTAGNDEECDDPGHDEREQEGAQNPTHSALKSRLERSRFPIVTRNHNPSILLYPGSKRSQTGVLLSAGSKSSHRLSNDLVGFFDVGSPSIR